MKNLNHPANTFDQCTNSRDDTNAVGVELYCLKHGPYPYPNCNPSCPDFSPIEQESKPSNREYHVSIAVDSRAHITVRANSPEEARNKAMEQFMDYDCGDLEIIDTSPVNYEDENGRLTDYS